MNDSVIFEVKHNLTPEQIEEADIREVAGWSTSRGFTRWVAYSIGPDDKKSVLHATPDVAFKQFINKKR